MILEPKTAVALNLPRGAVLRVVDIDGGQCADLVAFIHDDPSERLAQNWTRVHNWRLGVSAGDQLFTNRNRPLLTVTSDSLGVNDFLFPPCNRYVYETMFEGESQDGCFELLGNALAEFGVSRGLITDPLNVFMNIRVDEGAISIAPSVSRPGETLEVRAEHDCIVAVSACPDDRSDCNNHNCTRIGVEIV
jgi:uncharacterized protein